MDAQNVLLGHHHQKVHRPAHPVQQVLTPLQSDFAVVGNAMPGHMQVLLDRLYVQSVLVVLHQQTVHRRAMSAHHVEQGTTTL